MTNRIEWLKARQKGIGGADVAAILGINPYRTPLDIYREKTTEITEDLARLLTGGLNLRASWLKNFQNELDS